MSESRLQRISFARAALEKAKTVPEVKKIRDQALAIASYLKEQGELLNCQNDAAELKLRCERKLGKMIPEHFPNGVNKGRRLSTGTTAAKEVSLDDAGISRDQSSAWQKVASIPEEKFEAFVEATKTDGAAELTTAAAIRVAKSGDILVSKFTGDDENYTPSEWIDLVRAALGDIDLDPASNQIAQQVIKADRFYTIEDDGLSKSWKGKVFMNPPFSNPAIGNFIAKLIEEVKSDKVTEAILLTNDNTDTSWYHAAATNCAAVCLLRGRISFYKGDLVTRTSPTNGQTFFYFGKQLDRFAEIFGPKGLICVRYAGS